MTATDLVLIAALAVFVVAWWVRALPNRPAILVAAAAIAFVAGCVGVWLYRWQDAVGAVAGLILLNVLGANALRQAKPQPGLPFVSGSLFVIFAALAIALIVEFPVNPLPKPSGPYAVGVRTFELTDESRRGVLAAKPDEPRRLLVRVWYPAGDISGLKPRPYFTPLEARTMGRVDRSALLKFPPFFMDLRHVRTNSYEDAPLRPGSQHLPVVFYSHGYTSFLAQNTVLMEDLASHGYVVFSVQHTYDSTATLYPNGDVAPVDPDMVKQLSAGAKSPKPEMMAVLGSSLDERMEGQLLMREQALADKARLTRSGGIWLADQVFVHDRLQAGAVPDAIKSIATASDFSRVGVMGMSFGGAMAGDICVQDHRCAAGVNLDGSDFPFQAFDLAMPVPFLMFHSDVTNLYKALGKTPPATPHSYNEFSYEPMATAGSDPKITRVWLKGAQHVGLSDFSLFVRRPFRDPLLGTTPSKVLIGAQNDFVLGFFDRYLRGMQNGFPKPQLAAYAGWEAPLPNAEIRTWWAAKTPAEGAAIEARIERTTRAVGPEHLPAAQGARYRRGLAVCRRRVSLHRHCVGLLGGRRVRENHDDVEPVEQAWIVAAGCRRPHLAGLGRSAVRTPGRGQARAVQGHARTSRQQHRDVRFRIHSQRLAARRLGAPDDAAQRRLHLRHPRPRQRRRQDQLHHLRRAGDGQGHRLHLPAFGPHRRSGRRQSQQQLHQPRLQQPDHRARV